MRTEIKFKSYQDNAWELVDKWQSETGWKLIKQDEVSRIYSYSSFLISPTLFIFVELEDGMLTVQAWMHLNLMAKIMLMGLETKTEVGISTKGKSGLENFVASLPKSMCREALNKLLLQFKVEPII